MHQAIFNSHYNLTPVEADAHSRMSVELIVERMIEIATRHANALEVGYDELRRAGIGWVLSRMSIEIDALPAINDDYALNTWIESYNRHFCDRAFNMVDAGGTVMARAITTFVAIDMRNRTMADLSAFEREALPVADRPAGISAGARIPALPAEAQQEDITFSYSDIDFNRHVGTARYVARLLDHWPLAFHDRHAVRRLDMAFHHELLPGDAATLRTLEQPDGSCLCEITGPNGTRATAFRVSWQPRRGM